MRLHVAMCFLCLCHGYVLAQDIIGTQPSVAAIIPDGDVVHIITQTVDYNFNGVQDDDDLPAQWLIVDRLTLEERSTTSLPFGPITASRPAIDTATGLLFIGIADTVFAFTTRTQQRSAEGISAPGCTAIGYDNRNPVLYISTRSSFTDPGILKRIHLLTLETSEIEVGVNPQQTIVYRNTSGGYSTVTLCEGTFGQNNGGLAWVEPDGTMLYTELGDTPNHMKLSDDGNILYVVMNGSHAVLLVNVSTKSIVSEIPTPTTGFDGPREIDASSGYLFVTTYSSALLVYSLATSELVASVDLGAKADPVRVLDGFVWVGLSLKADYTPTGNVLVFAPTLVNVREESPVRTLPAIATTANTIQLPFSIAPSPLTISSVSGRLVGGWDVNHETNTVNVGGLAGGTYVVRSGNNVMMFTRLQ